MISHPLNLSRAVARQRQTMRIAVAAVLGLLWLLPGAFAAPSGIVSAARVDIRAAASPSIFVRPAAAGGSPQVVLAWNASTGATSYNVYRATSSGGEGSTPYASGQTSTGYTDSNVAVDTTYYYEVTAVNANGESPKSNEASTTTPAGSATHFSVTAPSTATAGTAFNFTVTALDQNNVTAAGYTGTVHFTSTDGSATMPANSTLTNGVGTFSVALKKGGTQTITATDTVTSTITGTSNGIAVGAATATHFTFSAPGTAKAGTAISVTVNAKDAYNNTVTGYTGTVLLTSSDPSAVLPAGSPLTNGTKVFSVTLKTAGSQTVTATDTVNSSITGTTNPIVVAAIAATHLSVSAPSTATPGTAINVTVTALDPYGNTATTYAGTVKFSSTDSAASLPANSTLTSGTGTFSVTLETPGSQTVTATDTVTKTITGVSNPITVASAAATHFSVSAPSTATSGTAISVTVTALDQFGNTVTGYTGTVLLTSTDSAAVLPAGSALTNGVGTFSVTLKTTGSQTVTATDTVTAITGVSSAITVSSVTAGPASAFIVSVPSTAVAGTPVSITVTAVDSNGNTATSYTGTVHFKSTDSTAVLPANSTLTNGVGTFSVTFKRAGSQTVTATDTVTSTITGTSTGTTVGAAVATHYTFSTPGSAKAGTAISVTVNAKDAYNNTVTGYTGTVLLTSSDPSAVLPAASTLTNGTKVFSVTLKTDGSQTITATDTATPSITATSNAITVSG